MNMNDIARERTTRSVQSVRGVFTGHGHDTIPAMPHPNPWLPITTAPHDGTEIEVRTGPDQETVRAEWSGQNQGWIRAGDPARRTLHRVSEWRRVTR
jgi:hypothetical protein